MNASAHKHCNPSSHLKNTEKRVMTMDYITPSKLDARNSEALRHPPTELLKVQPHCRFHANDEKFGQRLKETTKEEQCRSLLKRSCSDVKSTGTKELSVRRKRVRTLIVERLRSHPKENKTIIAGGDNSVDKIESTATAIETLLFRHRRCLFEDERNFGEDSGENPETNEALIGGLKQLMAIIVQRRMTKETSETDRLRILQKAIDNDDLFIKICMTVNEVKTMRLSLGGVHLFEDGSRNKLVQAARDLFFKTSLISAFDFAPEDVLTSLPWTTMLREAEQNILKYRTCSLIGTIEKK